MDSRVCLHPAAHRAQQGLSTSTLHELRGHGCDIRSTWLQSAGNHLTDPLLIGVGSYLCERGLSF